MDNSTNIMNPEFTTNAYDYINTLLINPTVIITIVIILIIYIIISNTNFSTN